MANPGDRGATHPRMSSNIPQGPGGTQTSQGQGQGITETLRETASDIGSRVGDAWESTRRSVQEGAQAVTQRACNFWTDASNLVRRRPMAAIGIALGAGFLLGCCMSMSMRYSTEDLPERMSRGSV